MNQPIDRSPARPHLRRADDGSWVDAGPQRDAGPRLVIGMGGPNLVVRIDGSIDRDDTDCLVDVINAAGETDTVVVVDPSPIRCDELFAGDVMPTHAGACAGHLDCRPVRATVVGNGVIRLRAESAWWMIDVARGRLCRTSRPVEPCFVPVDQWTDVVAVVVAPTRLRALTVDGLVITRVRAHDHAAEGVAAG